jgi:predicted Zn-dependent protease
VSRAPAVVLLLAAGLAGCAGVHHYRPNFYSVGGDIKLGQQLAKEVESEVPPLRHAALQKLLDSVGRRLQEASPDPAFRLFPYTFHVLDSPEINAFALPGGPVYVNTALIDVCESEDQLAAVLAHEMSHVAARHATEMLTTRNITSFAVIAAISVVPVPLPPIAWEGTKLTYVLALFHYNRGMEAEADRLGLTLMNAAGYDPAEMAVVLRRIGEQERTLPSLVERFMGSHPLTAERISVAEQAAARLPRPANAPVVSAPASSFPQVQLMFAKD